MTTKEIDPAELLRKFDAQHGEVKALFEAVGAKMTAFGGKQDGFNGRITEIEQTLARRRGGAAAAMATTPMRRPARAQSRPRNTRLWQVVGSAASSHSRSKPS